MSSYSTPVEFPNNEAISSVDRRVSTLIIGCGNLLRGDDAAGPVLIRRMWNRGLPVGVRCADGGTGGMDVAFQMRGVPHVILVDASNSGNNPGDIFEVPGEELEQLPPLQGINTHAFRWDHALAFGRWLLKDEYPEKITVYLIEGAEFEIGAELTPYVSRSVDQLVDRLLAALGRSMPADATVELTDSGYLYMTHEEAIRYFPESVLVALVRNGHLLLIPTRGAAAGGLVLKQRNAAGDRCVLMSDLFPIKMPVGKFRAQWDDKIGGLKVALPEDLGLK